MTITLLQGDALSVLATLPAGSIQTVITSPPYYGLRKYTNDPREIGQEAAPDCLAWARREPPCGGCYVCALRAVFAAVWRVLRDDGTCWINLGESMAGSWGNYAPGGIKGQQREQTEEGKRWERKAYADTTTRPATSRPIPGIKEKNIMLIPARVALALQSDGWIVRSDVIWSKPNAMPESVTDRPTRAHEYVYLLSKQARYYYDAEAIAEQSVGEPPVSRMRMHDGLKAAKLQSLAASTLGTPANQTRNKRSVWTIADPEDERAAFGLYLANLFRRLTDAGVDSATIGAAMRQAEADNLAAYAEKSSVWTIATRPYAGAHFATMPEALIEPCLLAGSSAQACETCGAAWGRVVERTGIDYRDQEVIQTDKAQAGVNRIHKLDGKNYQHATRGTDRFAPRCACADNTGAAASTVLDPFAGTFTVGRVAERFGRNAIGIELNPDYTELSDARTNGVQKELFN